MRNIKTRRTVIFVIAALALVLATGVYVVVPKGVAQMDLVTAEGEIVADSLEMYVGTETQLSRRVQPVIFDNRATKYTIADEEIATVDDNGLLTALKEGETLLTVECAGERKNYTIKALTAVEDIKGLDKEITLYEGDEFQLEPKVKMAQKGLEKPKVTYKVKRNTIASVDDKGLITALKEGKTTITVTAGNVSKKVKVIVEEKPVEEYYTPAVTVNNDANDNGKNKATKKTKKKTGKKTGGNTSGGGGDNTGGDTGGGSGSDSGSSGGDTGGGSGSDSGSSSGDTGGGSGSDSGNGDPGE